MFWGPLTWLLGTTFKDIGRRMGKDLGVGKETVDKFDPEYGRTKSV